MAKVDIRDIASFKKASIRAQKGRLKRLEEEYIRESAVTQPRTKKLIAEMKAIISEGEGCKRDAVNNSSVNVGAKHGSEINKVQHNIYVENGDIPTGLWKLENSGNRMQLENKRIYIELNEHLVALEVVSDKNERTLKGTGAAAIVGGVVLGPLGAIAGAAYGGKRNTEAVVICVLSDQKKFVAKTDSSNLPKLKLQITNSPSSGGSVKQFSQSQNNAQDEKEITEGKNMVYDWIIYLVLFIVIGIMLESC